MKLRFITFEHVTEAVKYLVAKDGGHLPYTDESGAPNHRLMGATWAALYGGYRGQKYDGPDKDKALSKLNAMYKSEKMDTPAESFVLDGEFFQEALPQSDSFDAIRCCVQTAIDANIKAAIDMDGDNDGAEDAGHCTACGCNCGHSQSSYNGCSCCSDCSCDFPERAWIRDLFPGVVVYSMDGELMQCDYTVNADDTVTLGTPAEVEMSYTPVTPTTESAPPGVRPNRAVQREVVTLSESAYDASTGKLSVTIIKPGFSANSTKGKRRFYPAETLKRDFKVFEGAKMFVDHATEAEAKARPEGSVHDWVANLGNVVAESDGTLKGSATVFDPPFKAKLDALNSQGLLKQMAVSMRAAVAWSPAEIEGQEACRVDELVAARSVDFVTFAGAGGQVEAMESDAQYDDLDSISEAELRKRRPDLVTVIESSFQGATMKSLETQLQEATTALAESNKARKTAEESLAESDKTAKKAAAQTELGKLLSESKLPEPAQKRIRESFSEAVSVDGMKEKIEAEKVYIQSFAGSAKVSGLGTSHNGTVTESAKDSRTSLTESFTAAGMKKEDAEIAAAGRR